MEATVHMKPLSIPLVLTPTTPLPICSSSQAVRSHGGLLRFLPSFRWQRPQPCHLRLRRSELLAAQQLAGLSQDFRISGSGVLGAGVGLIQVLKQRPVLMTRI